jgi:AraC family transcriptional regulator, melibiose operon regulatory protein
MTNSEIAKAFDEGRDNFRPYGLTCERWSPGLMKKPDRHNEIELNYFPEGSITYLFQDNRVTIPAKRLAVFWALIPHQIIDYNSESPYYVCTIPFTLFLEWKLPVSFVERVLRGEVVIENSEKFSASDEFMFKNWANDDYDKEMSEVTALEMHARLHRMAVTNIAIAESETFPVNSSEINKVEKIAMYVAQNYTKPITVSNIGQAVGLHPDYANAVFKKAFGSTLSDYIIAERISHAQRKLLTTERGITDIAFDCGFNSIGRFNAAFQKINQCTPRDFRKKHRQSL